MPKIVARFERMVDATNAIKELKRLGITKACLDAMDPDFSTEFAEEINVPGAENSPSLSGLVLNSGGYFKSMNESPLIAASPMVSGMGPYEETDSSHHTRLVANASEEQLETVKKIISESGGECETR